MGAWGTKNFENDAAADYVWDVKESSSGVLKVINTIIDFLNTPDDEEGAEEVLAAIEYIAAARGNPSDDLTPEASEFITDNLLHLKQYLVPGFRDPDIDIIALSVKAIDRIRNKSELKELWMESDDYNEWLEVLTDLEARVTG